jgi:hypothetical protein
MAAGTAAPGRRYRSPAVTQIWLAGCASHAGGNRDRDTDRERRDLFPERTTAVPECTGESTAGGDGHADAYRDHRANADYGPDTDSGACHAIPATNGATNDRTNTRTVADSGDTDTKSDSNA